MVTASFSISQRLITIGHFLVATISDASNPTVVLQQKNPPPDSSGDYDTPFQLQFTGLVAGKAYNFDLWESADTTPTGINLNNFSFPAVNAPVAKTRPSLVLQANTATGLSSGTTGYVDPASSLVGWTYTVLLNGYGSMVLGQDYNLDSNNNWYWITDKRVDDAEVYTIIFDPQITAAPTSTSVIISAKLITTSRSLTSDDANQDLLLMGVGQNIVLTMVDISTVADYTLYRFISAGGNHINASIRCFGSDKIQRVGQVSKVVLGQVEEFIVYKFSPPTGSPYWVVRYLTPTADMVGQFVYCYGKTDINTVFADGRYLNRQVYERLYDKALADGIIASDSLKTIGQYGSGSDSTNFSIPNFTINGFQMGVATGAGATIPQNIPKHDHTMHGQGAMSGYFLSNKNSRYSGGGGDRFGVATSPDTDVRTDFNNTNPKNMIDNTACYISIRC